MTKEITTITETSNKLVSQFNLNETDARQIVASFSNIASSIKEIDQELIDFGKPKEITLEI